jgi:leucyl-tRNA synthetase
MSKSKGNVISPDDVVKQYGADTLRMYEMFMGPLADTKPWDTKGIIGVHRFLSRIYQLGQKIAGQKTITSKQENISLEKAVHKTIKKVTADMDIFAFNTAISSLMIYLHELEGVPQGAYTKNIRKHFEALLLLVSPMAPHLSEELWCMLGHKKSIMFEKWPVFNEALTMDDEVECVVQINGKHRDTIRVPRDISEQECVAKALDSEKIKGYIASAQIKKTIFVKGRLLNIVI